MLRLNFQPCQVNLVMCLALLTAIGCAESDDESSTSVELTSTSKRAERRAYDGAPPVIPHEPLKASCVTCHTQSGEAVPRLGFAPANPHFMTSVAGTTQNCRQCHLFQNTQEEFTESTFVGIPQTITKGKRAYPGAPPTIPHSGLMRENCIACHSGQSSRPEIRCKHTERVNCRQCHLFESDESIDAFPEVVSAADH